MARVVAFDEDLPPTKATAAHFSANGDASAAQHDGVPATAAPPVAPPSARPHDPEGRQHPRSSFDSRQQPSQEQPESRPPRSTVGSDVGGQPAGRAAPPVTRSSESQPAIRVASPAGKAAPSHQKAASAAAAAARQAVPAADGPTDKPATAANRERASQELQVSPFANTGPQPEQPPSPEHDGWPAPTERHSLSQARVPVFPPLLSLTACAEVVGLSVLRSAP